MTIGEIVSIADSLKRNEISEEVKLHWINDVEGRVHCEIFKFTPESYITLTGMKQELMIPMPYARIYIGYILAMAAFASKEYDLYSDLMMRYERDFAEYAKFCLRTR